MQQARETVIARDRRTKWLLLLVSLATLAALAVAVLLENFLADWQVLRREYAAILEDKAVDARGKEIADRFSIGMEQTVHPDLNAIDRCITCHTGIEDPRMTEVEQPFTAHPGRHLEFHDPQVFGCTTCHLGQGRATETADAHGNVAHWDYPMLEKRFMTVTCTRCHSEEELHEGGALLTASEDRESMDLLHRGRKLTEERGCLGCHALNGKGGTLSLDLTTVGDKTRHGFDFSHFAKEEPRHVVYWHEKHFMKPAEVAPGTTMPAVTTAEEAEALTAYMLSLRPKLAETYHHSLLIDREPPQGGRIYARYCSSCHGTDGREGVVPDIYTPMLHNADTLAVADDNYYRFIISSGRSTTNMTSWKTGAGNLSKREIDRIVEHMRSWEPTGARVSEVNSRFGDPGPGRAYYQGLCANCHGRRGEGSIGNTLNSLTFLAAASDDFLAETIVNGRSGTAMPSWKRLPAQGVSDLLSYIRKWQPHRATPEKVKNLMQSWDRKRNATIGRFIYEAHCIGCHGRKGEGGIGLQLNSPDVLRVVDDQFLSRTIIEGRPSTAMPAWRHLKAEDVGAVIEYVKTWRKGSSMELPPPPPPGDYDVGELHYNVSCLRCHGEEARGGVGPQLNNPVLLSSVSDTTLFHWISRGRTGTAMKGFHADEQGPTQLREDQIADVIAYLRHLGMRKERPVLRTGVGNSLLGGLLFRGQCASCHGYEGEGASGPQLNNSTFLRSASDGFLAATIVLGRTGTPMQSMIHGQEGLGQITPAEVQDVIAYLRLWDVPDAWRKPRLVAEMSERAIIQGRDHYKNYCSGCHGLEGRGTQEGTEYFAPSLNNPEFLQAASDGFLLATIARGRMETPMRPFGKGAGGIVSLPPEEINDIVSFIRTWLEGHRSKGESLP